ncbi:sensor histidine kinase [Ramlibacter sp.]|uniref:sensor histidine kinase n=1 Tax=Ramlibacter sp. TaxID=1917967 RepID=UPI002FC739EA
MTSTGAPSVRRKTDSLLGYAAAVLLSAAFLALRFALEPWLRNQAPLIMLLAPPILAAWVGGFRAGALATLICAVAGEALFVHSRATSTTEQLRLAIFTAYGLLFSWLIASWRSALRELQAEHGKLLAVREKLSVRERRLRETLEASPSGMIVVGPQGRIELVNREAERQFGYTRQEMVGMAIDDLVPPGDRPGHARLREGYHAAPVRRPMGPGRELHGRRKDGSVFPVQIGLNPVEGMASGLVLASVLDISSQRAAEAARRDSEQRARAAQDALLENAAMFQSLADNIAQLAWMVEPDGSSRWFNRRWYEYTGTRPGESEGWGWQGVHHPDHLARVMAKFRQHLASGEPWEDTFPLRSRTGEYRWFLSRAFPLRDHGGRIVRWFGTNTDITDHLEAEAALREADRRKDEFIAMLAHELRNPLAPVRNAVEILKRTDTGDARLVRLRDIMDRQVGHMARLIDDLLDVSRMARGKLTLRLTRCDLAAIACQTAEDYRPSLEASGQQLVLDCGGPFWVEGDPVRLAQMLGNLLNNAVRFQQGPGTVEVRTRADPATGQVHLSVADTGIGMDPQLLGRLFTPFSQADQDIARTQGGLGLGLALARGLAELHGGRIVAESEGPGRGSLFRISLPLAPVDAATAAGNAASGAAGG